MYSVSNILLRKEALQLLNIPAVRNKLDKFWFLSLLPHIYNYILF